LRRFNTLRPPSLPPTLTKTDGRREAFDERKLRTGFERSLQKRPVSGEQIDVAVRNVIHALRMTGEREVASRRLGVFVMDELKKLDQVAYVRFASVYRRFEDVADFRDEIERLERDARHSRERPSRRAGARRQALGHGHRLSRPASRHVTTSPLRTMPSGPPIRQWTLDGAASCRPATAGRAARWC
jgi:transcriptional regulator NrdR